MTTLFLVATFYAPPTTATLTTAPPTTVPPTDWEFCSSSNPCEEGIGDCDEDSDCQGDLKCGVNNCVGTLHHLADCCFNTSLGKE